MRSTAFSIAAIAVVLLVTTPGRLPAATGGLAWDSVTKIVPDATADSLQPGSFDSDYATAASAPTTAPGKGGMFGKLMQAAQQAQLAAGMVKTGIAEKHYVAGSKDRVDHVVLKTATITDCSARTITTLDLAKKTYHVESMDHPSTAKPGTSSGSSGPETMPTDDGTRIAISVNTKALGAKTVGGQQTNGYQSNTTFTETKPGGETHSTTADVIAYYTGIANPSPACGLFHSAAPSMGPGDMAGGLTRMMQAFQSAGIDKRITVSQTGPQMPFGKLSMFDAATFAGGDGKHNATFLSERGNVRTIDANDAAFTVPADFTKV